MYTGTYVNRNICTQEHIYTGTYVHRNICTQELVAVTLSTAKLTVTALGLNPSFPSERSAINLLNHDRNHIAEESTPFNKVTEDVAVLMNLGVFNGML